MLNGVDKRILEILVDKREPLNIADFWYKYGFKHGEYDIQPNLDKLKENGYISEIIDNSRGRLYEITTKGKLYLTKPPLSRGERIIICLTIVSIIVASIGIVVTVMVAGK